MKTIALFANTNVGYKGFSYFINENGERVYMNIKFSKTNNFKK